MEANRDNLHAVIMKCPEITVTARYIIYTEEINCLTRSVWSDYFWRLNIRSVGAMVIIAG